MLDDDRETFRFECYLRPDTESCLCLSGTIDSYTQYSGDPLLSFYDRLHNLECYVRNSTDRVEAWHCRVPGYRFFRWVFSRLYSAYSSLV